MKKNLVVLLLLFISANILISQTHDDAVAYLKEGIKLVDAGNVDEGIKLIKKAIDIEPKNTMFNYELAFTYYKDQKYDKVIDVLEKIKSNSDSYDQIYAVLGNAYDILGDRDKALETYKAGLKKFPNSGKIYLELGIVEMSEKNYEVALKYFEKGIQVEPTHPSNYYWASIFLSNSSNPMWSIIYGEIFLNLEFGTKRTEKISKLVYDSYRKYLSFDNSSGKRQANILIDTKNQINKEKLDIESKYSICCLSACIGVVADTGIKDFDIKAISNFKKYFIECWYTNDNIKGETNALFEFFKLLNENNMLEPYTYYVLEYGNKYEFDEWFKVNKSHINEYDTYLNNNLLILNNNNSIYRGK